jgi:hypothetical protein
MKRNVAALCLAAALLSGCDRREHYRQQGDPPGQNPAGTPSDRTGGARNVPDDGAGGGSQKNTAPADQPAPSPEKK